MEPKEPRNPRNLGTPGTPSEATIPDIVLLAADWQPRTLLRGQLLEEGYRTVAFDEWDAAKTYLTSPFKPRLVVVDLQSLAGAGAILDELKTLIDSKRVLLIGALGAMANDSTGFDVVSRPITIGGIVAAVKARVGSQ